MTQQKKLIGLRLKQARKEVGLTQQQLGKEVNFTQANIAYYESGKRNLSLEDAARFSKILKKDIYYFLGDFV